MTGGSSPERAYALAAGLRRDWRDVELWWSDERCVPPEHEWSNFGLVRRTLLDRVQSGAVHRIAGELGASRAAAEYDAELEGVVPSLVLLGLGADGHVASLFPNAPGLRERKRRAIPAEAELEPLVERVSLTIPVLESTPLLVFLVTGESKAEAVARAFAGPASEAVPGSLVRSLAGRTLVLLDPPAAGSLGI